MQSILNGFQHEQPDYWLTFGNPWEIERLIVSYPIKFYGHVSVHNEEGRQVGCQHPLGWPRHKQTSGVQLRLGCSLCVHSVWPAPLRGCTGLQQPARG